MSVAFVCLLSALAAAPVASQRPLAEVWPYQATRLPDGRVQYSYDLSGLKAGMKELDAASELDEAALDDLAKALPKQARVIADQTGALHFEIATEREKAPLSPSFSQVPSSQLAAATPIEKGPAPGCCRRCTRIRRGCSSPPRRCCGRSGCQRVHARGGVARRGEGTLGLPMGGKALWQGVLKAALERAQADSDGREGAQLLAELVGAALKRQGVALPPALQKSEAVEERLSKWDDDPACAATTLRSSFSAALQKLELRDRALSQPFPDSRAGKSAALTFLAILEKDAKLKAGFQSLEKLRGELFGAPSDEVLASWRKLAEAQGSAQAALEDFATFVAALQRSELKMPAPFVLTDGPIERALNDLGGVGQESARDDVVAQLEEGRLSPDGSDSAALMSVMDWATAAVLQGPEKGERPARSRSRGQRSRLSAAFEAALPAPATSADADVSEEQKAPEDRRPYGMQIALKVPPQFTAEPTSALYGRLSAAYARMEKWLAATGKAGNLNGILPGGAKRSGNNKTEVAKLKKLFRGLQLLSSGAAASEDKDAIKAAEQFASSWKADPELSGDVRFAGALRGGGQLAVYGVGRQAIEVSWERPPKAIVDEGRGFQLIADTDAPQRFIVPLVVTGSLSYPGALPDRAAFRALSDKAGRLPSAVDASLLPGAP